MLLGRGRFGEVRIKDVETFLFSRREGRVLVCFSAVIVYLVS